MSQRPASRSVQASLALESYPLTCRTFGDRTERRVSGKTVWEPVDRLSRPGCPVCPDDRCGGHWTLKLRNDKSRANITRSELERNVSARGRWVAWVVARRVHGRGDQGVPASPGARRWMGVLWGTGTARGGGGLAAGSVCRAVLAAKASRGRVRAGDRLRMCSGALGGCAAVRRTLDGGNPPASRGTLP